MAKLNTFVHVVSVDADGAQQAGTFGPADDLPDWAAAAITNPDVWDGDAPERAADSSNGGAQPPKTGQDGDELTEPPRSGAGSGLEAWVEYAKALGYEVAEGTKRDDIIAAIDADKE